MKYYKHYIVDNHKIKKAALLRQPLFFEQNPDLSTANQFCIAEQRYACIFNANFHKNNTS